MFTLTISCLTTSNLLWFMDLTFQVPMQYCSLQHQTHPQTPDTSTTEYYFCFGPAASFFLELLVITRCSAPVAYWTPTNLWGSSSGVVSFFFSYCSWGSPGKNTAVVCHSLLQRIMFCQNAPLWPVHLGWPCIASLSYTSPFTTIRRWPMKGWSSGRVGLESSLDLFFWKLSLV